MVWLTAMGLTIGLVMVVYLIGLIVVNGLAAFWPTAWQIELREGSKPASTTPPVGGKIVKIQQKATQGDETRDQSEWQVMVGNKEVYGFGFNTSIVPTSPRSAIRPTLCSLSGSNTVMLLACQLPCRSRTKGQFQRRTRRLQRGSRAW